MSIENAKIYKCPACGGGLQFDIASQKLVCPFCESSYDAKDAQSFEELKPSSDNLNNTSVDEGQDHNDGNIQVFMCQSCGGEVITDNNTAATSCPYCGNPVILSGRLSGSFRPKVVIPFKKTKEDAEAGLKDLMSHQPLLPTPFKLNFKPEKIQGLYVPYWLFNADVEGHYQFRAERVKCWSDDEYDYERTDIFRCYRDGCINFRYVPINASKKLDNTLAESIEPFDYRLSESFNTSYLSGFLADKYDVSKEENFHRASERMKNETSSTFASTVNGYTSVYPEKGTVKYHDTKAIYALYPLWILSGTYKDQIYTFLMNGQTGKIKGNLPMSINKLLIWGFSLILGIAAIFTGIASLIGEEFAIEYLIIGLFIGLIVATIVILVFRSKLKNVKAQYGANDYKEKDSFKLYRQKDVFIATHTDARPKPHRDDDHGHR